jgi:hypothetical protein
MAQHETPYRWTGRDKLVYAIALVSFLVAFIGTIYLLGTISAVLSVILLGMYLMANVFQAGCCVGCPYRGKYCPALFGVYLGNWLSSRIYVGRQFNPRFFKTNATLGEISVIGILVFSGFWLASLNAWYVVILLLLVAAHLALFLALLCPKCGYCETCPAGKTACRLFAQDRQRS